MQRNVLLFDLDGTLVDSAGGITAALSQLRAERGAEPIDALLAEAAEIVVATL